jgi:HEAT repeat protein
VLALFLASLGGLFDVGSAAAGTSKSGGASLPGDALKRLKSGDSTQVAAALDDVRVAGKAGAPAVPAIVDLLAHGLPPDLTQSAVDTLGDTESEAATPALAWYARHRNVAVRRGAVQALARTRGPVAVRALRAGLSDPDPAVRGFAATGLGTMKAKEALADLFVALDHKVVEASPSIGELCAGDECDKLAAKLGTMPFEVITSGLDVALFRLPADVNDDIKIKIVARVRELGTGEANRFLRAVQSKWPRRSSTKVKQAIDQAVLATSASPGAEGT